MWNDLEVFNDIVDIWNLFEQGISQKTIYINKPPATIDDMESENKSILGERGIIKGVNYYMLGRSVGDIIARLTID